MPNGYLIRVIEEGVGSLSLKTIVSKVYVHTEFKNIHEWKLSVENG